MSELLRRKATAASLHLLICAVTAFAALIFFRTFVYPPPLFEAVGGMNLFLVILVVDVVLGPVLTFVVYAPKKRSLKFDLSVIAMLQLSALGFGAYTLFEGRPVFIASLGHRFDLVQANEIDPKDLETAGRSLPWFGPEWVGYKQPADPKLRNEVLFSSLGGRDYGQLPQYHAPLETMKSDILKFASPLSELKRLNGGREQDIDAWLMSHGVDGNTIVFQGLRARSKDMAVIVDSKTANVIGIAPFKPWP